MMNNTETKKFMRGKIKEATECFTICVAKAQRPDTAWHKDVKMQPSAVSAPLDVFAMEERYFEAESCPKELITALWEAKDRLDFLFDMGLSRNYYRTRDEIFRQDRGGSSRFWNRAGDKLCEVLSKVGQLSPPTGFVDICGGPGAFSQVMLRQSAEIRGVGITLRGEGTDTPHPDGWYEQLLDDPRFTAVWGPPSDSHESDRNGDVYQEENLLALQQEVAAQKIDVNYVVADGGFRVSTAEWFEGTEVHVEHLQEAYSGRLVLSELYGALLVLQQGGNFVCKLFDSFTYLTISIIYVVANLFEDTYIVKPKRSRIVNSERYLVGKGLRPENASALTKLVKKMYRACTDDETPQSLVPVEVMKGDTVFWSSIVDMNEQLAKKQTKALNLVIDGVLHRPSRTMVQKASKYRQRLKNILRVASRATHDMDDYRIQRWAARVVKNIELITLSK